MIDKIKALLAKLGVNVEGKTDVEITTLAKEAGLSDTPPASTVSAPTVPGAPVHNAELISGLNQKIEQQNAMIGELKNLIGEMKTRSDKAEQAMADSLKTKRSEEIKTLLAEAVKAGKIPADNKDKLAAWQKQLEEAFDAAKFALAEIPGNASVAGKPGTPEGGKSGTTVGSGGITPGTTPAGRIAAYVQQGLNQ